MGNKIFGHIISSSATTYFLILPAALSSPHSASCISYLNPDSCNVLTLLRGTNFCDTNFRGTNHHHAGESWPLFLCRIGAVNFE